MRSTHAARRDLPKRLPAATTLNRAVDLKISICAGWSSTLICGIYFFRHLPAFLHLAGVGHPLHGLNPAAFLVLPYILFLPVSDF